MASSTLIYAHQFSVQLLFDLHRDQYIAGNSEGNPLIFKNPGIAGNASVMCVITPKDSSGTEGEKTVSQWMLDNMHEWWGKPS